MTLYHQLVNIPPVSKPEGTVSTSSVKAQLLSFHFANKTQVPELNYSPTLLPRLLEALQKK